jgi:phosphopantetheinyl transferase
MRLSERIINVAFSVKFNKINRNCEFKRMPLYYHTSLSPGHTVLAVWQMLESENWFQERVPQSSSPAHGQRRLQHLAGRFLLSQADPTFPYAGLRVNSHGRPYLEDGSRHFSISHSADMVAAVVSNDCGVGVDLEFITPRVLKVAPRFLGVEERHWLSEYPGLMDPITGAFGGPEAMRVCTLLWSAKEAAYKWLGIPGLDFAASIEIEPFTPVAEGKLKARFRKDRKLSFRIGYRSFGDCWLTWIAEPLTLHQPALDL